MKRLLLKLAIAFGISTLLTWTYLFIPEYFQAIDNKLRDNMFMVRGELEKNNSVVIVDIDEKSLREVGQWPWSRDKVAELLEEISTLNAGVIGLDIVFSEEDRTSPHKLKSRFPQLTEELPNNDLILAECFKNNPVVGGYIFKLNEDQTPKTNETPVIPAVIIEKGLKENRSIIAPKNIILNTPLLQNALYSSGFFNNIPEEVIRSVPLIMKYDNQIYPSLPFEMIRIFSGENIVKIGGDDIGTQYISLGQLEIPVDNFGRLFVNFRGPRNHFEYISAVDILSHKVAKEKIENKFVLVGTSALGLFDLRVTALDTNIPGVEIHANVIDNLLQGDFLSIPSDHVTYEVLIIFGIVFLLILILNYLRHWIVIPVTMLMFYLLFYVLYILLFDFGVVLNILFPLLAFIITVTISTWVDFSIAHKEKEIAKKMLEKKVSTNVMKYLLKHADKQLIAPKKVDVTVLFSDIVGFTRIAETTESPDKLINILNTYMTPMAQCILKYEGTIDKFIGDSIMAYWNAPVETEHHADKAVQSALEQLDTLKEVNLRLKESDDLTLKIGIGIHSGMVTSGDMGSAGRSDYTIIGDNVNIAARLENLTRFYGVDLLITETTYHSLQEHYTIRPIDIVRVKGKENPIEVFEVVHDAIAQEELELYEKAVKLFRSEKIDEAYTLFQKLQALYPCKLYRFYNDRCETILNNPDEPFTIITSMQTK